DLFIISRHDPDKIVEAGAVSPPAALGQGSEIRLKMLSRKKSIVAVQAVHRRAGIQKGCGSAQAHTRAQTVSHELNPAALRQNGIKLSFAVQAVHQEAALLI